ncbi:MAG TPA: hypothetical protein VEV16_10650 [Daejeonella sp.]|nr:hypothetical protein [Daejeonella sp.]
MKNSTRILGLMAGLAAATIFLMRKRVNGRSYFDDIVQTGNSLGNKILQYGNRLRSRFMPDMKGPHGEDVLTDRYDRHYYLDEMHRRVYVENA